MDAILNFLKRAIMASINNVGFLTSYKGFNESETLIDTAARYIRSGQTRELERLLKSSQLDPSSITHEGDLLLQIAIQERSSDSVRILLEGGANPNVLNAKGEGVLYTLLASYHENLGREDSHEQSEILSTLCQYGLDPFLVTSDRTNIYLVENRERLNPKSGQEFFDKLFYHYWSFQLRDLQSMSYSQIAKEGINFLAERGFYHSIHKMNMALKGKNHCFYPEKPLQRVGLFYDTFFKMKFDREADKDVLAEFIENFPDLKLLCPEEANWSYNDNKSGNNIYVMFLQHFLDGIFLNGAARPFKQMGQIDPFEAALAKKDPILNNIFSKLVEYHLVRYLDDLCEMDIEKLERLIRKKNILNGEGFSVDLAIQRYIALENPNYEAIKSAISFFGKTNYYCSDFVQSVAAFFYRNTPTMIKEYLNIDSLENLFHFAIKWDLKQKTKETITYESIPYMLELFLFKDLGKLLNDLNLHDNDKEEFFSQFSLIHDDGDLFYPSSYYRSALELMTELPANYSLQSMLEDLKSDHLDQVYAALTHPDFHLDLSDQLVHQVAFKAIEKNNIVLLRALTHKGYDLNSENLQSETAYMHMISHSKCPFWFLFFSLFANKNRVPITIPNSKGISAYDCAVKKIKNEQHLLALELIVQTWSDFND